MSAEPNPLAALRAFDARFRALSAGLPGGADDRPGVWRGIGFSLAGHDFVAPMSEVREVLSDPLVSRVPGARPWVRGLANMRGRLVTVVDLAEFLQLSSPVRTRGQRALCIERGELSVGLLVDGVSGAKHLAEELRSTDLTGVPQNLRPYVTSRFISPAEQWSLFDLGRVLASPEFLNAAA